MATAGQKSSALRTDSVAAVNSSRNSAANAEDPFILQQLEALPSSSIPNGYELSDGPRVAALESHDGIWKGTELFFLERDCIEDLCRLESRCYPAPWSSTLIHGEFDKKVSMRLGVRRHGILIAYSFNYLVADELHILNVAVAPEHRGVGYGRGLFAAVLDTARKNGARYAALEVRESNLPAQKLYSNFGFQICGRRRAYYRNNGEDALVMEREL